MILFVDDNEMTVSMWAEQIDRTAIMCYTVEQAEQHIFDHGDDINVVVCDGKFPVSDGERPNFDACRTILRLAKEAGIKTRYCVSNDLSFRRAMVGSKLATHESEKQTICEELNELD